MNVVVALAVVAPLLVATVNGACSQAENVCEPSSGVCLQPVVTAISGQVAEGFASLQYGKYCGAQTCRIVPGEEQTLLSDGNECAEGSADCPVTPCDGVDAACQQHDYCLEAELTTLGLSLDTVGGVGIPQRCQCEAQFVYSLSLVSPGDGSDLLCDAGFYALPIPEPKDASLFAAVPCCVLLLETSVGDRFCAVDANDKNYSDIYNPAVAFCEAQLGAIQEAVGGFDICGAASSAFNVDADVPMSPERCTRRTLRTQV